jgi:TRAP-type C4-dicarboxylate transport system permease small subunit
MYKQHIVGRFFSVIDSARQKAIVVLFTSIFVSYMAIILFRYFPVLQVGWLEEVARHLHIWMVFLAAGAALRAGYHASVTYLLERLPRKLARTVSAITDSIIVVFLLLVVTVGSVVVQMNWTQEAQSLRMIPIPWLREWLNRMCWAYMAIPVGGALMIIDLVALRMREGLEDGKP